MDNLADKIREFFEKRNFQITYLLKNKYENPKADFLDEEIEITPYTVIYRGNNIFLDDSNYSEKINFEKEYETKITCFLEDNCNPIEGVLEQLISEGYEII